jgi:rRNA maturation RNase YbeY
MSMRSPAGETTVSSDSLYDLREADARRAPAPRRCSTAIRVRRRDGVDRRAFARPKVIHDELETDWRRSQARMAVVTDVGEVKKNEKIVDAGERVTVASLARLRSLEALQAESRGPADFFYPSLARMTLLMLFVAAFAIYLRFEQPSVYRDNRLLLLCASLVAIAFGIASVVTNVLHLPEYAVPLAFAPLILSILFDKRLAVVFTLLLVVAVSSVAEYRPTFIPVSAIGGIVAIYAVRRLRHRRHFYAALFTMAMAVTIAIVALDIGAQAPVRTIARDVFAGIMGSALSAFFAMEFLAAVEAAFRIPSDITLLELSDLNRPLMRRLMMEAPGTYHHSLLVGSLAEAAAESIGANSLGARCAYHHDIGKLSKPEYYTENEPARVAPRAARALMSALVIKSHVTEGLELAQKEKPARGRGRDPRAPRHDGDGVLLRQGARRTRRRPTTTTATRPRRKARKPRSSCSPTRSRAPRARSPNPRRLACAGSSTRSSTSACTRASSTSAASRSPTSRAFARRSSRCSRASSTCEWPTPSSPDVHIRGPPAMPISLASTDPGRSKVPARARARLLAYAARVLAREGVTRRRDVVLGDDALLRSLYARYKGATARPTCCRSPIDDVRGAKSRTLEGEIYVSPAAVYARQKRYRHEPGDELLRLVTHGLLHLCGHDHMKPGERRVMRAAERVAMREDFAPGDRGAFALVAGAVAP